MLCRGRGTQSKRCLRLHTDVTALTDAWAVAWTMEIPSGMSSSKVRSRASSSLNASGRMPSGISTEAARCVCSKRPAHALSL